MATISHNRSSYQDHSKVSLAKSREPFACPDKQRQLIYLQTQAIAAANSTTQAAYLLRLNCIREIVRTL